LNIVLQFIYWFGELLNGSLEIIECEVYDQLQLS
jgi:hypothetical protein